MLKIPNDELSYWRVGFSEPVYPTLKEDISVDVVVVGGGIIGLTAAYLLKQSGLTVAVVEKNTIGSGTTGHTTGKVTSQHSLIYADLVKRLGIKTAQVYAEANNTAVENIAQLIETQKIDCGWERDDNYVFTTDPEKITQFKDEAETAASLGLPATFETDLSLPFKVEGSVKFANQGKFHAPKYVHGLAALIQGHGSHVFENSNVISFRDGSPAHIRTKSARVTAKNIIVATKMPASPLIARFACAAVEYPHTSYIVAGRPQEKLKGMYISPDKGHYSLLPVNSGDKQILLIGGQKHIPGLGNPRKRHQKLADYAEEKFGMSDIEYRWKGMDYLAYDGVPLVGRVYPWSKHMYTATGFNKWGLNSSMVAGTILHDLILGKPNSWAATFKSMRLRPIVSIPRAILKELS